MRWEVGKHDMALAAIEEALRLYRQLETGSPDTFRPDVAASLSNLADMRRELGRLHEAVAAIEEAADVYRELAEASPDVYGPYLNGALDTLSAMREEELQH
jgi:tetratricopeptide (TPR) repeat protein